MVVVAVGPSLITVPGERTLSAPINRLNALLSLLHPLDRYRTPCAWVKPGRFGSVFVICFLALGGPPSPDALFTRIWDTRKRPESATFSCFPC